MTVGDVLDSLAHKIRIGEINRLDFILIEDVTEESVWAHLLDIKKAKDGVVLLTANTFFL